MKYLKRIIPIMLCACLLFCVACGDKPNNNGNEGGGNEKNDPPTVTYTHTLTATDVDGNPIADAWFEVFYYADAAVYGGLTVVGKAKTDSTGVAGFVIEDDTKTYMARVAEYGTKSGEAAIDYRYRLNSTLSSLTFAENKATAKFDHLPSRFNVNNTPRVKYSRYNIDGTENGTIAVEYAPYKVDVKGGVYSYFNFAPYVSPTIEMQPGESSDAYMNRLHQAIYIAQTAASGKYNISYFVTPVDTKVTMYKFIDTFHIDQNTGVPSYIGSATGDEPAESETIFDDQEIVYFGDNYITLDIKASEAASDNVFGIIADGDCSIEIIVERIGDATKENPITLTPVYATENLPVWTDELIADNKEPDDEAVAIPYNGSATTVLGEDGYYHVGTANGPILYAVLTKSTRFSDTAIQQLPGVSPAEKAVFTFPSVDDPDTRYDFYELAKTYCELANNAYGMYPVNEELKNFLVYLCSNSGTEQGYDYWLMPCKYFGELEIGEPLNVGQNSISLTADECRDGKLFTVTSAEGGTYRLIATDSNVLIWFESAGDPVIGTKEDKFTGNYTFTLEAGKSISFYFGYLEVETAATYTVSLVKVNI